MIQSVTRLERQRSQKPLLSFRKVALTKTIAEFQYDFNVLNVIGIKRFFTFLLQTKLSEALKKMR